MALWMLSRKDVIGYGALSKGDVVQGITEADCIIVRAENEDDARKLACECAGDEGKEIWTLPKNSVCECLDAAGKKGVILVADHIY